MCIIVRNNLLLYVLDTRLAGSRYTFFPLNFHSDAESRGTLQINQDLEVTCPQLHRFQCENRPKNSANLFLVSKFLITIVKKKKPKAFLGI